MSLSDSDIDYIENELKQTTVGGTNSHWKWPPPAAATHWYNAYERLEQGRSAVAPTPTYDLEVFPGEWATKHTQVKAGMKILLRGGIHPQMEFTDTFTGVPPVITCEAGTLVKGFLWNGTGNWTLDGVYGQMLTADVGTTDENKRVVDIRGNAHDITVIRSKIEGGFVGVYPYNGSGGIKNIQLIKSEVFGSWGDLTHWYGVDGIVVDQCYLHDPRNLTDEHHDCFQPSYISNWQFTRNICSWLDTNVEGHYTGPTSGGPGTPGGYLGQGLMLSGNDGPQGTKVQNGLVANNLIHHYNGRPINMNGVSGLHIVYNTFVNSGDDASITYGSNCDGVEIWNNIIDGTWNDVSPSAPAYFDYNWNRLNKGNMHGSHEWTSDPGFIDEVKYFLAANAAARGKGVSRGGEPTIDLDGVNRTGLVLGCRVG